MLTFTFTVCCLSLVKIYKGYVKFCILKIIVFNYHFKRLNPFHLKSLTSCAKYLASGFVAFLTLLFSELNLLSLSLCTISRHLNSEAIFLPLPCSSPLLHCIQREDEELGGHRWREVLCLFPSLLSEWMSPQMGLYWKANTNLQSNERAVEAQGHARHIANCTC